MKKDRFLKRTYRGKSYPKFFNLSLSISSSNLECISVAFLLNYSLPKHLIKDCNTPLTPIKEP